MKLQDIQSDFQRIVLEKECSDANWVSGKASNLSTKDRLRIYHNAYRVRLVEVMEDTFEHTKVYLGDEWFDRLANAYVQSHPSSFNNIGLYGAEFGAFLAKQLPDDGDVAELATMDWVLRRAFDGADSDVMTLEDLQQLAMQSPEGCRLQFVPTLTRVTHHFNTLDIWHAIDQDNTPPAAQRFPAPVDVLVWRKGHSPHFRSISPIESAAIDCVLARQNLDHIGASLQNQFPEADIATEFGVMIQRWIGDELLALEN